MLLCCITRLAELLMGGFLCTQGAAPGSRELTAGGTARTVGQPETLLQHQLDYRRLGLCGTVFWGIKQGCAGEFLSAQGSAQQPTGTSCSALSLSHLIENTKS